MDNVNNCLPRNTDIYLREGGLRTRNIFKNSDNNLPLLSIVTVVFNGEKSLEETIISVVNQSYLNIEYIIIDGASQDRTLDIVCQYQDKIDYWLSEPDKGVYDAMNKAISLASGDWLLFLGSDDILADNDVINNVFSQVNQAQQINKTNIDAIAANVKYLNNKQINSKFSNLLKLKNTVHHQAAFYKKELFSDFSYNSEFKISSDYELNLKLFVEKITYLQVDELVTICSPDGLSGLCYWSGYLEEIKIRNKYLPLPESTVYNFLTILRFLAKKITLSTTRIFTNSLNRIWK
ncbi:putative glycosyl transferase [Calothrix brevissima NIES-22]|nr:putative glycosyl transferase [Calothrix brevissima NIES-22]